MSSSKTLVQIASCEARLVEALTSDASVSWSALPAHLNDARHSCVGEDVSFGSLVDELQAIASLFAPKNIAPYEPPAGDNDPRFGYGVVAAPNGEVIYPSFAAALQKHLKTPSEIANELPLLSVSDNGLWHYLRSLKTPTDSLELARAIALRWLRSPGRRLAWDLSVLDPPSELGVEQRAAIIAAAGIHDDQIGDPAEWPYVHACTPLTRVQLPPDDDAAVVRALRALAAPQWIWSRSQAITALLERAASLPQYRIGTLTIDLREELPARVGAIFAVQDDEPILELEWELLRLSSLLTSDHSASVAFRVARWIGYVIAKSPFQANDPRVLAAKLAAVRRGARAPSPSKEDDVLHPRRLLATLGTNYKHWREFVTAIGAAGHYLADADVYLTPMPVTLLDQLRVVAARELTPSEAENEAEAESRVDKQNKLSRHIAPPWIARAVLHRTRSSWLAQLDKQTIRSALAAVDAQPTRYSWLLESVALAAGFLRDDVQKELASWWAKQKPTNLLRPHQLLLVGAAALGEVASRDLVSRLEQQLSQADAQWRPFVANALVAEARRIGDHELEDRFLASLANLVEDASLEKTDRERALAWLLQRLQVDSEGISTTFRTRLVKFAKDPLVTNNSRLKVLMAELGFDSRGPSK